ncbi:MAG: hypothetical protein KJ952_02240, partial [Candidatus Omnitrophica bacterium]|nr:hypothetical protein [Candidatus Omnitrophota bacterium]
EDFDMLKVKIVTDEKYSSYDESRLEDSIKNFLGEDIKVCIEKVSDIPRTSGGKFKQFISKIEKEEAFL